VQHIAALEDEDDVRYTAQPTRSETGVEIDCVPGGFVDWILRRKARTVYAHPGVDECGKARWILPTGRAPSRGMLDSIDQINVRIRDKR
jgi:hypothetical protein